MASFERVYKEVLAVCKDHSVECKEISEYEDNFSGIILLNSICIDFGFIRYFVSISYSDISIWNFCVEKGSRCIACIPTRNKKLSTIMFEFGMMFNNLR